MVQKLSKGVLKWKLSLPWKRCASIPHFWVITTGQRSLGKETWKFCSVEKCTWSHYNSVLCRFSNSIHCFLMKKFNFVTKIFKIKWLKRWEIEYWRKRMGELKQRMNCKYWLAYILSEKPCMKLSRWSKDIHIYSCILLNTRLCRHIYEVILNVFQYKHWLAHEIYVENWNYDFL